MTQAGLAGSGFFVITVLAGELAGRLAREELSARGSLEMARQQAQLNRLVIEEMEDGVLVVDRARQGARRQPGGAAPARARRHEPRRRRSSCAASPAWGRSCARSSARFAEATWPEAGRDVRARSSTPTRAGRCACACASRGSASRAASEEFCVLFLEDVRSVQARSRQEKLAAMGRVSAGIAHEIRNPLAAIAQANALLAEDATDPAQRQLMQMVTENVERLKRIVDDVMEVAPGQVQEVGAIDATAQVAAICAEWAQAAGVAARRRTACLQRRAAGRAARRAVRPRAPAPRARQPARQRPPPRQRQAGRDPGPAGGAPTTTRAVFSVLSDGAPIPADVERLFVRAVFLDPQPRRGSGPVHLPRALRAIRRPHRLPAAAARSAAPQRVLRRHAARRRLRRRPTDSRLTMTTASHFSLLVVDDEPDLRTLYELTLLREGYDLDTAGTVQEALLASRRTAPTARSSPTCACPTAAGLDVLRWLEESSRREKAIVITAYGSSENAVEALEGGRLRLPHQAGRPEAVPRRRRLGARPRRHRRADGRSDDAAVRAPRPSHAAHAARRRRRRRRRR